MLAIDSFYELNALLRAILVVKFECDATDPSVAELAWSCYLAAAANRIYDATIEVEARRLAREAGHLWPFNW